MKLRYTFIVLMTLILFTVTSCNETQIDSSIPDETIKQEYEIYVFDPVCSPALAAGGALSDWSAFNEKNVSSDKLISPISVKTIEYKGTEYPVSYVKTRHDVYFTDNPVLVCENKDYYFAIDRVTGEISWVTHFNTDAVYCKVEKDENGEIISVIDCHEDAGYEKRKQVADDYVKDLIELDKYRFEGEKLLASGTDGSTGKTNLRCAYSYRKYIGELPTQEYIEVLTNIRGEIRVVYIRNIGKFNDDTLNYCNSDDAEKQLNEYVNNLDSDVLHIGNERIFSVTRASGEDAFMLEFDYDDTTEEYYTYHGTAYAIAVPKNIVQSI